MKQVAATLKDAVASEAMQRILNRAEPVFDIADTLLDHWKYDLYTRKPGPAYFENGALQPTDLDLACFLSALVDRKAVIVLPHYKSKRAKTTREGEHVLSRSNRHGQVLGMIANKEVFSFSIRVFDQNVIQQGDESKPDQTGAFRSFMLVDLDGTWHEGWSQIEFMPTAKENAFLNDRSLWTDNTVVFKNFVHPNRWISFYGQYYMLTKALIDRLEQENKHLNAEIKRLLTAGFTFPLEGEGAKAEWPHTEKGESKPVKVPAFEATVDLEFRGMFNPCEDSQEALIKADALARRIRYSINPALRFATRATELAFAQAGAKHKGFPAWIKGASWETGYREPGGRTAWERLVLHQAFPGQRGVALRYRQYEKTERVAA